MRTSGRSMKRFALHFREDSFAAGHVTGNWGNSAVRKGTHDAEYNCNLGSASRI
jgi:hypothetical protein